MVAHMYNMGSCFKCESLIHPIPKPDLKNCQKMNEYICSLNQCYVTQKTRSPITYSIAHILLHHSITGEKGGLYVSLVFQ